MGCGITSSNRNTVPIKKSLVHLIQTNQNQQIIKALQFLGPQCYNERLNFFGDTVMHIACSKNNLKLVQYLKNTKANFSIQNYAEKYPVDLATDENIIKLLKSDSTNQSENKVNKILNFAATQQNLSNEQKQIAIQKEKGISQQQMLVANNTWLTKQIQKNMKDSSMKLQA